jgi:hypothetical protein
MIMLFVVNAGAFIDYDYALRGNAHGGVCLGLLIGVRAALGAEHMPFYSEICPGDSAGVGMSCLYQADIFPALLTKPI